MDLLSNIYDLEVINQEKNLKRASEKLYVDHSTLSKRIKKLEEYYNTQLLIRKKNNHYVSDEGKILIEGFKEIKEILDELQVELDGKKDNIVATSEEIFLSSALVHGSKNQIVVLNSVDELVTRFNDGEFDSLIIDSVFEDRLEFTSKKLFTKTQLEVISAKKGLEYLLLEDLQDYNIIVNHNTTFGTTISEHVKHFENDHNLKGKLHVIEQDNLQEILCSVLLDEKCLFFMPSSMMLPDYLSKKMHTVVLESTPGRRRINKYIHKQSNSDNVINEGKND